MPVVRFAYSDPTSTGQDAPSSGEVRLQLAAPEASSGVLRSMAEYKVPLVAGAASVNLTPGFWHVGTDVPGHAERWLIVPNEAGPLDAADLAELDPGSLAPDPAKVTTWENLQRQISELGAGVTLEDDPSHPGVVILTVRTSEGVVVTQHPVAVVAVAGASASFTATASGEPSPTVRWQVNDGAGWVDVEDVGTSAPPLVVQHPQSAVLALDGDTGEAGPVTFVAAATGSPSPVVKWQTRKGSGAWEDIMGAVSSTYTIPVVTAADSGRQYRAVFSNGVGSPVATNPATLTVGSTVEAPVITTQPTSQTVVAGNAAVFTSSAAGASSVRWQLSNDEGVSWSDVPGATASTLTLPGVLASDDGLWVRVVFTNTGGSTTSAFAALVVVSTGTAPTITTQPTVNFTDVLLNVGAGPLVVQASAAGSPVPSVQWQRRQVAPTVTAWADLDAATFPSAQSSYFSHPVNSAGGYAEGASYQYRAVFTNSAGSVTSAASPTVTVGIYEP